MPAAIGSPKVLKSDATAYLTAGEEYEERLTSLSLKRKAIPGEDDPVVVGLVARLQKAGTWGKWRIPRDVRVELEAEFKMDTSTLLQKLTILAQMCAAPVISAFHVGAVALGTSGDVYFGPNVEVSSGVYARNPCLRHTIHAEQAAVLTMLSHGERGLQALYISHVPCGVCRQFLCELKAHEDLDVWTPQLGAATKLGRLLPFSFGPEELGKTAALLSASEPNPIALAKNSEARLVDPALAEAAEQAAQRAYAPYTSSYAGVALRLASGQLCCGHSVESAAFNPTVSPMQMALISLLARGGKVRDIEQACFAEDPCAVTHFKTSDTALLTAVAPHAELWFMPLITSARI